MIGQNASETTRRICDVYPQAVSIATTNRWFQKFMSGDDNLKRKEGSGKVKSFDDNELKELVDGQPHLTLQEYADILWVTKSAISKRMKNLNYTSKRTFWVPHELSVHNIHVRKETCLKLLEINNNNPFLKRLMTSDESYVLYETPQRRNEWSMKGLKPSSFPKGGLHPKKIMLCIWWDCEGIIYREYMGQNTTVNADKYCAQLLEVQKALVSKRPALINRGNVVFQHDNARPHVANKTRDLLKALNWQVLPHPPYSPDIAPSDYHLFLHLKNELKGKKFRTTELMIEHIDDFFASKPKSFYYNAIQKLPILWEKIVKNDGKYL